MKLNSYEQGRYCVNPNQKNPGLIENWITNCKFQNYEKSSLKLDNKSRKRNKLYTFYSDESDCNVIMKVSEISKDYKFWRKVDLFITSLYKDYNYNSFRGSLALQQAEVDSIIPIAYWTVSRSLFKKKSYFLYKKVESNTSVTQLCSALNSSSHPNKDLLAISIARRCIIIVKKIHTGNVRHGDPHAGNILTNLDITEVDNLNEKQILDASFIIIDNDRCTFPRVNIPIVKRFFDMKCLARFNICDISNSELLRIYLDGKNNNFWSAVLRFWKTE